MWAELNINRNELILLGIYREGEFLFNPANDMPLQEEDTLVVIGIDIVIQELFA